MTMETTVKKLKKMSKQRIFRKAVLGVLKQGKKSGEASGWLNANFACKYRGPDGLKCAAGHLIDDCDYDSGYEGTNFAYLTGSLSYSKADLITSLQANHDGVAATDGPLFVKDFALRCIGVAKAHGLDASFIHGFLTKKGISNV